MEPKAYFAQASSNTAISFYVCDKHII